VEAAFGLKPLATLELAAGDREIRLWPVAGAIIPSRFVRVAERGGTAVATLYAYWPDDHVHGRDAPYPDFETRMRSRWGCGPIRHSGPYGACVLASASPARARTLVAYLDSIQAWSAADVDPAALSGDPGIAALVVDGAWLGVSVRRGPRHDATAYFDWHLTPGSAGRVLFQLPDRFRPSAP
jgi:hypothetical protein